jgi:hypothetical protein
VYPRIGSTNQNNALWRISVAGEKLRTRNSGHETTPIGGAADLQPSSAGHGHSIDCQATVTND